MSFPNAIYGESAGSVAPAVIIGPVQIPANANMMIGEIDLESEGATVLTLEISENNGVAWRNVRTLFLAAKGNLFRGYAAAFSPVDLAGGPGKLFRARIRQPLALSASCGISYISQNISGRTDFARNFYGEDAGGAGPTVIVPAFVVPVNLRMNLAEVDLYAANETLLELQQSGDGGSTWGTFRRFRVPCDGMLIRPYDNNYPLFRARGDARGLSQFRAIYTQPSTTGPVAFGICGRFFSVSGEV
jgi:hypothetical protein